MKYLIVGLGNIGDEYAHTRHNMGFETLDAFAKASNVAFSDKRYGAVALCRLKGHELILLKPSTYVNLSGNAVRYWMQKEKVPLEQVLVVVDDLALPFGMLRLKPNGSAAGHNGLKHIEETLGTQNYARLRFGIDNNYARGADKLTMCGHLTDEEKEVLPQRLEMAVEMIKCFCLSGIQTAMNLYNNK